MSEDLVKGLLEGEWRALARLITLVESRGVDITSVMEKIFPATGRAIILGFTGPPGAGKSSLVDRITTLYRGQEKTVGIIAIDPSSPFSGGALLGDRIRMHRHFGDTGVFIRSLGTRGSQGGLSRATRDVVRLMDAAGLDVIMVETVGVGQTELDIMELARTTMVVLVPESGDVVQTMKAGLTEIADIFLVNKADRAGSDAIFRELTQMVHLNPPSDWKVPVLLTQALKNIGIDELFEAIKRHGEYAEKENIPRKVIKLTPERELIEILAGIVGDGLKISKKGDSALGQIVREVSEGVQNPYAAARKIASNREMLMEIITLSGQN